MRSWLAVGLAAMLTALTVSAAKAEYPVATRTNLEYVQRDGTKLSGDLYLPKGLDKAPVVIAMHGGGWQNGSRAAYKYWGPFFAKNGIAVFAIGYRLGKPGAYPGSVYDVKAAVRFVRTKAADLGVDPDRIGLMGDSAGAHLAALVGLAADEFNADRGDSNAGTSAQVKAVIGFYGVYDMLAQWHHDQIARPRDQITEKFLGASPMQNRRILLRVLPDELCHGRPEPGAVLADSRNRRRHRRPGDAVLGVPGRAQPGRHLRAPDRCPRRRPFLGVRSIRKRAWQLRRHRRTKDAAVPGGRIVGPGPVSACGPTPVAYSVLWGLAEGLRMC